MEIFVEVDMSMAINFRGVESTGGVADKQIETAKQETTGGIGAIRRQDSIFLTEEPKCDTVCFRGLEYPYETPHKTSATAIALGTLGVVGTAIILFGLAHKYDFLQKYIKNENILKYAKKIIEPCHQLCKWIKVNAYDKVLNFIKSKI